MVAVGWDSQRLRWTDWGTFFFAALSLAIVSYLAPYILSDEENESDSQPNRVRVLKVP